MREIAQVSDLGAPEELVKTVVGGLDELVAFAIDAESGQDRMEKHGQFYPNILAPKMALCLAITIVREIFKYGQRQL